MEEKIYFDFQAETGRVRIAADVVAAIASGSACEVEGIAALAASAPDIADMLIKKSGTSGVNVEKIDESSCSITITATGLYGSTMTEVAKNVQQKVKADIESMTGLTVNAVNVYIAGISFDKK